MIRVADYIMKRLAEEKVSHLYYVPGGQCVYLMDALRRSEDITPIAVHHEQAAAMAALTYGLYHNRIGACVVTTGCAGTNTMTGLLHAWQDSIPCVFISGQQSVKHTISSTGLPLRQMGIQEADTVRIVEPLTKYAKMVTDPMEIAYCMDEAITYARSGRKGPVWLDIPLDVQSAMVDESKLSRYLGSGDVLPIAEEADIQKVAALIADSERPVILAGAGVRSGDGIEELTAFAHKAQIPVVLTRFASDLLPYDDEMNFGVVGSVGANRNANFTLQNSDFLLCLGTRLGIDTTGPEYDQFARAAKTVVVDIDRTEHQKPGVTIDHFIEGDAKDFLQRLQTFITGDVDRTNWLDTCRHWKEIFRDKYAEQQTGNINFKYLLERLSEQMPENATALSDAGLTGASSPCMIHVKGSGRFLHSFAQGEMGYVLPGAFGACDACKNTVVAITGDGSVMMNLQELQTLYRNQYDIKLVIINNNGYSGVRHGQKAHFRGKSIGTDPSNGVDFPDFGKVAAAFRIDFMRIDDPSKVDEQLKQAFSDKLPRIIEVMCDPDQFDLHNALVKYDKRKFGFRPIEDQSPFIDRETFFKEMIIEPLETCYGEPV